METSMICALPDDLLLKILHRIPIKDAIATSVLSQRWRYVWTMMFILEFNDDGISESLGCFIDKTLQLHKAPKLFTLTVKLSQHYSVDVDVIKEWVEKAVKRCVKNLNFKLLCGPEPTRLPKSLYTCETLVELTLSNQIFVDVPSPTHLPSLLCLTLDKVVYKDEDCLDRLLSSSPVLGRLKVNRRESDNLKTFMVKVSSLTTLSYDSSSGLNDEVDVEEDEDEDEDEDDLIESLVIDSPALRDLTLLKVWEDDLVIEKTHWLEKAVIGIVYNPNVKFLRCFSFVIELNLFLTQSMVACCSDANIIFSRLTKFGLYPNVLDWMDSLMFFLRSSPKLKTLTIDNMNATYPSPSWNQPSNIPECLSNHLEVFRWRNYRGGREGEKQLLAYILANSNCLKTVDISLRADCNNLEDIRKEIESIPMISASSRLLLSSQTNGPFT